MDATNKRTGRVLVVVSALACAGAWANDPAPGQPEHRPRPAAATTRANAGLDLAAFADEQTTSDALPAAAQSAAGAAPGRSPATPPDERSVRDQVPATRAVDPVDRSTTPATVVMPALPVGRPAGVSSGEPENTIPIAVRAEAQSTTDGPAVNVAKSGAVTAPDRATSTLVPRSAPAAADDATTTPRSERWTLAGGAWYRHPYVALAAVVVVMIVLARLVQRWMPSTRVATHDLLRVVARASLTPKQTVMLLHVGRRLVVVSVSGDEVRTLSEITDPEEVSLLLGRSSAGRPIESGFDKSLAQELVRIEDGIVADDPPTDLPEVHSDERSIRDAKGQLEGLLARLRALQSS